MSKLIGMVNNLELKDTYSYLDGYIFGLKNYSVNFLNTYSLSELKGVIKELKQNNKEIFLAINKNLHSKDISNLKEILKEIEELKINGIFYADNSFITLKEELNLKTELIWYQEHLITSYTSINTYYDLGIKSACISNDIPFSNVKEIVEKTNSKLFYMVFGYLPVFISERHQIKNYLNHFKLINNEKIHYFISEGKKYPIIDSEVGTFAFSDKPMCAYKEYLEIKNNLDYAIISDLFIEKEDYIKIIKQFKEEQEDNDLKLETNSYFLYQDTIYKIK